MTAAVIAIIIVAVFAFAYAASAVRIVRPYQRGVKERLGKYHATLDPGLRIVIPLVDKIRLVDMREQVVDVPPQEVITEDNVVVSVDGSVILVTLTWPRWVLVMVHSTVCPAPT